MKSFFLVLIFSLFTAITFSQSASEAEVLFNNKQYLRAKNMYETLLKRKPNDALLNYRFARSCYEIKDFDTAIKHFELAGTKYPLTDAYLAELYFQTYQFDLAIKACQNYIDGLEPDDKNIIQYERLLKKAELGARLLNRVEEIAVIDSVTVNKTDFLKAYSFKSELGTLTQQRVKLNNKTMHDKVTFTTQRADRSCFSDSVKGNMDIFTSFKLLNEWTLPVSISNAINTKANENYPFLLADGITLYYASDGENSLGGYDIFITKYASSSKDFLTPENIGFPFNSTANDYMMVVDEQHKTGWFASDRYQQAGKLAVYSFTFSDPKQYYKSDDSLKIRNVAKLKTYNRAKTRPTIQSDKREVEIDLTKIGKQIVINDTTIYANTSQFQQTKALQLYNEAILMDAELQTIEKTLQKSRKAYDEAEGEEKKSVESQIKMLEPSVIRLKKEIATKKKQAVNEEIKFLFNK